MKTAARKNNFSKKLIEQTERSARIVGVFEKHGFEISSIEKFQQIVADLFSVLEGGTAKGKRGRKPGSKNLSKGPGRPAKKRGRKPGRPAGTKKRGRPRKSASTEA